MAQKNIEGQMDFLGLLTEYTDGQGATVRVREPIDKHIKVKTPDSPSAKPVKVTETPKLEKPVKLEKAPEPEQFKLDFIDLDAEFERELEATDEEAGNEESANEETVNKKVVNEEVIIEETDAPKKVSAPDAETEAKVVKTETAVKVTEEKKYVEAVKAKRASKKVSEAKRPAKIDEAKRLTIVDETKTEGDGTASLKVADEMAGSKVSADSHEMLFKQCARCWCFDCRHNSLNEGVPREMCGVMMACPACESCKSEDMATICEIGNAKEGCKTRAIEEGIFEVEEVEGF